MILFTRPLGAVSETLQFQTAVSVSRDGSELRSSLRAAPRLTFSGSVIFDSLAEEALAALREGRSVWLPLRHAPMRKLGGAFTPTDSPVTPHPWCILAMPTGELELHPTTTTGDAPAVGATAAWPAIEVQLSGDSSTVSPVFNTHTATMALESVLPYRSYSSPSPASAGSGSASSEASPLLAPPFIGVNHVAALKRSTVSNLGSFDVGYKRESLVRFQKDTVQLGIPLFSLEEVNEFRNFVCALRGAAGSFIWQEPETLEPKLWRLASDAIQLQHYTEGVATANVAFTCLGA